MVKSVTALGGKFERFSDISKCPSLKWYCLRFKISEISDFNTDLITVFLSIALVNQPTEQGLITVVSDVVSRGLSDRWAYEEPPWVSFALPAFGREITISLGVRSISTV